MKVKTRSQRDMKLALDLVAQVEQDYPGSKREGTKGRYQALCQEFPVQVRTMGLAQALAFAEAKKGDKDGLEKAYECLLNHVTQILGIARPELLEKVQAGSAIEYMHYTRRVLDAWVFFKRFAESVLTVAKGVGDAH